MKQLHHTHPASTTYLVYRKQDNGRRQKNKTAEGYARSKMHQDSTSAPPAPRPQRSLLTYWQRRKRRLQQDWKRAVPATLWWNEHNDNTAPSQGQPLPSAPSQRRLLPSTLTYRNPPQPQPIKLLLRHGDRLLNHHHASVDCDDPSKRQRRRRHRPIDTISPTQAYCKTA